MRSGRSSCTYIAERHHRTRGDTNRGTNGARMRPALIAAPVVAAAQYLPDGLPGRGIQRASRQVFAKIGENAVAVVQGVHQTEGFTLPRQHNTFYYLSGIETPGAYLLLDGRTKKVTIYLPPRNQRLEAAEGRVLSADDVELVKRVSGVDDVQSVEAMATAGWPLTLGACRRRRRTRRRPRRRGAGDLRRVQPGREPRARAAASWCRPRPRASTTTGTAPCSRQRRFVELLRARQPRAEIRNLNPILDEMRSIKSPREIALVRRASQIAGLGDDGSDAQHRAGRHRISARRRGALRVPRQRRAPRGLPLDHRQRHREHQQHALLPQHVHAQGRRPGADGLRAGLSLLHERHRPRLAGQRQVRAVAARAAAVHPRVPQRRA